MPQNENSPARRRGFTLVELLVVIAIIGALAAIATPMIGNARRKAAETTAVQSINEMTLALESFQGQFGDYPPTSIEDFYEVSGNRLDAGIESVVLHLASRKRSGPFMTWKEDFLDNLDGDSIDSSEVKAELDWYFGNDELREFLDPWGNPYYYVHNRDYGQSFAITHMEDPTRGTATAGTSEKTATFHSPTTFQLWSAGPDMVNENGGGDDLVSW